MPENTKPKASPAAAKKAEEEGVPLETVEGTGANDTVTTADVEQASRIAASGAVQSTETDERRFEAKINPDLPGKPFSVRIGARVYVNGTPITASEAEDLRSDKSDPTFEHPNGVQYILKGKEITA